MPRSRRGGRKRQIKRLKWRLIEAGTFDPRIFDRPPPPDASPRRHGSPGPFELPPPQPTPCTRLVAPAPPCHNAPPPNLAPFRRPPPRLPPGTDTAPIRAPTRPAKVDRQARPPLRQGPRITSDEAFVGSLPKFALSGKATPRSIEAYKRLLKPLEGAPPLKRRKQAGEQ
ncbi:proline-rich receptor-like protein kinase PERK10 [Monomorium pharaonis]|uniref:proline-rich receptor-like protein kinase PERK10 n=1 Tax=Monomorium pharaonis TaxID=307658 RepID=UPI0017464388|nr:proline-rich receptor-like protein kinase PERK10 [Monomorium pharaonis]